MERQKVNLLTVLNRFRLLNEGKVFINNYAMVFLMFGRYWGTNKKRQRMYALDDVGWKYLDICWCCKVLMILKGDVKSLTKN